jgi:Ca2+-binding EF-hand superfamily protein
MDSEYTAVEYTDFEHTDIEYTVTETVYRNRSGQIIRIDYSFDETLVTEAPSSSSSSSITRHNKEKRNRTYDVQITREQYQTIERQQSNALSFDSFVSVLRPFIMGYYVDTELEKAFQELDRDRSGTIHLNEFNSFLPILNETIDDNALKDYVRKVDDNFDGTMNYDEFRSLVLRGIGRDIICNHL